MDGRFLRCIAATCVIYLLAAGTVRGDNGQAPPSAAAPPCLLVPKLQYGNEEANVEATPTRVHDDHGSPEAVPAAAKPGKQHPLHRLLQRHNLACWSHHNNLECGSFKSECTFIFGSCRAFFGERCNPGPPAPPWTPDYSYGPPRSQCR
jgi:hypothetical protein